MKTPLTKSKREDRNRPPASECSQQHSRLGLSAAPPETTLSDFENNHPDAIVQRDLQELGNNGPQIQRESSYQEMADCSPQVKQAAQLQEMANNGPQVRSLAQMQGVLVKTVRKKENKTGLPDNLKAGIENLSGLSMDDVQVHYNSSKPAQLNALAYTQGTDIHVESSQERHLPHEAWHVVQHKQGRVKSTGRFNGMPVNDNAVLEREATAMGERAASSFSVGPGNFSDIDTLKNEAGREPVQRMIGFDNAALGAPFFRAVNAAGAILRPPWVGRWAAGAPGVLTRNHIIGFHHIAESLANILNAIYCDLAAGGAAGAAVRIAHLRATTDALFPSGAGLAVAPIPEYHAMVANRTALVAAITGVANFAAPTAIEIADMETHATALEADLMSSPENVRAGDAHMNLRVGENIDADYGPIVALPPAPGPLVPAPVMAIPARTPIGWVGAGWGAMYNNPAIPNLVPGNTFYTLTPASNSIVYNFITTHAHLYLQGDVTIVRNDDPANMIPGYTAYAPLSSTALPAGPGGAGGGGIPVIVFDPAGAELPYRFG